MDRYPFHPRPFLRMFFLSLQAHTNRRMALKVVLANVLVLHTPLFVDAQVLSNVGAVGESICWVDCHVSYCWLYKPRG